MQSIARIMPTGQMDESVHRGARRKSRRYPLYGEVQVTSPRRAAGFLFNASSGGLRVALDHQVEVGSQLELSIAFDDHRTTHERAEVVWTTAQPDGWIVGLRFV